MFNKLFRTPTHKISIQTLRYGIAGAAAFTIDASTLYVLTEFAGLEYLVSASFGFMLGMLVSYLLDSNWVFNTHSLQNRKVEILLFVLMGMVGLGINELVIWLFTDLAGVYYMLSKVFASVAVYLWNFFSRRYLLFNPNRPFLKTKSKDLLNTE